jgi:hypothetical protein
MADTNFANPAVFTEQSSSATPPANTVALYPKTDGRFYGKDDAGTEFAFGTIGGTLGTVDNAVPRADGTGGVTAQGSDIVIDDATTSTQNNVAIVNAHAGQTNSALVLTPKGTGAFILGPKPDGTATGGNARGANAVDLQIIRDTSTKVASGANSFIGGGRRNRATVQDSVVCGGFNGSATGQESFVGSSQNGEASGYASGIVSGWGHQASAFMAFVGGGGYGGGGAGNGNTASAFDSAILGGACGVANRVGMQAHAVGRFSTSGDAQRARFVLRCKTTTNTGVEMALDGATTYLTIPSGKVIFLNIKVVGTKSDGSAVATYERQYAVKNVAATSSEVYAPITIGTDNAAGTTLEVATVDAGDYVRIRPTGITSETWRWVASVDAVEVAYGT